jgi:hypothetical protein
MNDFNDSELSHLTRKYNISDEKELRFTLSTCESIYTMDAQSEVLYEIDEITDKINKIRKEAVDLDVLLHKYSVMSIIDQSEREQLLAGLNALINMRDDLINKIKKRHAGRPKMAADKVAAQLLIDYWINSLGREFKPYFQPDGCGGFQPKSRSGAPEAKSAEFIVEMLQFAAKHAELLPEQPRRIPDVGSIRKIVETVRNEHFPETIRRQSKRNKLPKIVE